MTKQYENRWVPLSEVAKLINRIKPGHWCTNLDYKYIDIRIDTRTKRCLIFKGNREEISLEELKNYVEKAEAIHSRQTTNRR